MDPPKDQVIDGKYLVRQEDPNDADTESRSSDDEVPADEADTILFEGTLHQSKAEVKQLDKKQDPWGWLLKQDETPIVSESRTEASSKPKSKMTDQGSRVSGDPEVEFGPRKTSTERRRGEYEGGKDTLGEQGDSGFPGWTGSSAEGRGSRMIGPSVRAPTPWSLGSAANPRPEPPVWGLQAEWDGAAGYAGSSKRVDEKGWSVRGSGLTELSQIEYKTPALNRSVLREPPRDGRLEDRPVPMERIPEGRASSQGRGGMKAGQWSDKGAEAHPSRRPRTPAPSPWESKSREWSVQGNPRWSAPPEDYESDECMSYDPCGGTDWSTYQAGRAGPTGPRLVGDASGSMRQSQRETASARAPSMGTRSRLWRSPDRGMGRPEITGVQWGRLNDDRPQSVRRREMTVPKFDGTADLSDFLVQFEAAATWNRFTDEEKGMKLACSLLGEARGCLSVLPPEDQWDFETLKDELISHYEPAGSAATSMVELWARRCKEGESAVVYGNSLRKLASKAYPGERIGEPILIGLFIKGLRSVDVRRAVHLSKPRTLSEAITFAHTYESWDAQSKAKPRAPVNAVAPGGKVPQGAGRGNGQPRGPPGELICWQCGEVGHLRMHCSKLSEEERKEAIAAYYEARRKRIEERAKEARKDGPPALN
jgi:hypothetical protein